MFVYLFFECALEVLSKTFRWIVISEFERPYASNLLISNPLPHTHTLLCIHDAKQSSDCGSYVSLFSYWFHGYCFVLKRTRNDYIMMCGFSKQYVPQKRERNKDLHDRNAFLQSVRCPVAVHLVLLLCFTASITFECRTISLSEYIFNQFWEHFYLFSNDVFTSEFFFLVFFVSSSCIAFKLSNNC